MTDSLTVENKPASDYVAIVAGEIFKDIPKDLYIPPEALKVVLEIFEGPLDLLLYLIKRHNLDILNIPVAKITKQYIYYIEKMAALKLEITADYLEMAALLIELKSRMMLPREIIDEEDELDPRAELVRRLQEYERFKTAADNIDNIHRIDRDIFIPEELDLPADIEQTIATLPEISVDDIVQCLQAVLSRADLIVQHEIQRETLSVRAEMANLLNKLKKEDSFFEFTECFSLDKGRAGIIVTFLAILELTKETLVELVQNQDFGPIYIRAVPC